MFAIEFIQKQILYTDKKLKTLLDIKNSHVSVIILFVLLQDIRSFIQTKFFVCIEFKRYTFFYIYKILQVSYFNF